jgi:phage FluMu gp28-like protein
MSAAPSLDYFCDYQRNWILEPAAQAFGEKSRRIGFTHAVAFREVQAARRGTATTGTRRRT